MPKYELIEKEIEWCEANRNQQQKEHQDGFIAGLYHALFLMKSSPIPHKDFRLVCCGNCGTFMIRELFDVHNCSQAPAANYEN